MSEDAGSEMQLPAATDENVVVEVAPAVVVPPAAPAARRRLNFELIGGHGPIPPLNPL